MKRVAESRALCETVPQLPCSGPIPTTTRPMLYQELVPRGSNDKRFPANLLCFGQLTLCREHGPEISFGSGVVGRVFQNTPEFFFRGAKVEIGRKGEQAHRHSHLSQVRGQANCLLRSSAGLRVRFLRIVCGKAGCVLAPSL